MSQKSIEINIPTVFTEKTMYEIVAKVFLDDNFPTNVSSLDIDLKDLKYIDVAGVTVLSNLIELAQNFKIPVNFNYNDSVASFLIDSGFAQRYIGFPDDNLNKKNIYATIESHTCRRGGLSSTLSDSSMVFRLLRRGNR